jgi:hypothetical protein
VKTRRVARVGIAVVASLAFAAAGCATATETRGTSSPSWVAPSAADARKDLLASVEHFKTTSFKASAKVSDGATVEVQMDPAAKVGTKKIVVTVPQTTSSIVAELRVTGGKSYAKVEFNNMSQAPRLPTGWMQLDLAKLDKPKNYMLEDPDPANLAAVFNGLRTVQRDGKGRFTGTLDLTKVTGSALVDSDVVAKLGDKATEVPFHAAVDGQGRITSFTLRVPAYGSKPAETWEVTYTDWGAPVTVDKPSKTVAPNAAAYEFFNA